MPGCQSNQIRGSLPVIQRFPVLEHVYASTAVWQEECHGLLRLHPNIQWGLATSPEHSFKETAKLSLPLALYRVCSGFWEVSHSLILSCEGATWEGRCRNHPAKSGDPPGKSIAHSRQTEAQLLRFATPSDPSRRPTESGASHQLVRMIRVSPRAQPLPMMHSSQLSMSEVPIHPDGPHPLRPQVFPRPNCYSNSG